MIKYFAKYSNSVLVSVRAYLPDYETLPTDCIEVSKDEFITLASAIGDISNTKEIAKEAIDKKAGEVRLKYITAVPGQAETYLMKSDEAFKIKTIGYNNISTELVQANYPVVFAEMTATGQDVITVCETILMTEHMWRQIAAIIERERRQAKIEVDNCTNTSQVVLALESAYNSFSTL